MSFNSPPTNSLVGQEGESEENLKEKNHLLFERPLIKCIKS